MNGPSPRSPWPIAIATALATTCTLQLGMVAIATSHRSASVPGDHEREALEFDHVLAARGVAAALGWHVEVAACDHAAPDGTCALAVSVEDGEGRPVAGLRGVVTAARADDATLDREAPIAAIAPGRYAAAPSFARGGLYRVHVTLEGDRAPWVGDREVLVPDVEAP